MIDKISQDSMNYYDSHGLVNPRHSETIRGQFNVVDEFVSENKHIYAIYLEHANYELRESDFFIVREGTVITFRKPPTISFMDTLFYLNMMLLTLNEGGTERYVKQTDTLRIVGYLNGEDQGLARRAGLIFVNGRTEPTVANFTTLYRINGRNRPTKRRHKRSKKSTKRKK